MSVRDFRKTGCNSHSFANQFSSRAHKNATLILLLLYAAGAQAQTVFPTSYDMLNGNIGFFTYFDDTYDGQGDPSVSGSPLTGGLGDLTDGTVATQNWNVTPTPWVCWISANGGGGINVPDPTITFRFADAIVFDTISLNIDDSDLGGVSPPLQVLVNDLTFDLDNPDGTQPYTIELDLEGLVADTLVVQLIHRTSGICLAEATFAGQVAEPFAFSMSLREPSGPLVVDGVPTDLPSGFSFSFLVDQLADDTWAPTDFGLFEIQSLTVSVPDLGLSDEPVITPIRYFEDNSPSVRAGLSNPFPDGGIQVDSSHASLSGAAVGDPNVVDVPPSLVGQEPQTQWFNSTLTLADGTTITTGGFGMDRVLFANSSIGVDDDGDGIPTVGDNCSQASNPQQLDADADGFGNRCDADFNNDCIVNVVDLGLFREAFFSTQPNFDLNGDGIVNVIDLGILRTLFFEPPGPSAFVPLCDLIVGLSAYYSFENGSLQDQTPNGNDGSAAVVMPAPGIDGKVSGLEFQRDAGTVVTVPHSDSLQPGSGQSFSVNVWFQTSADADQFSGDPSLISKTQGGFFNGWDLRIVGPSGNNPNRFQYLVSDASDNIYGFRTDFPVNDGAWHMATLVLIPTALVTYFDGAVVASIPLEVWNGITTSDVLEIGNFNEFSDRNYEGLLDEIRIYQKALTQAEIDALFAEGALTR